MHLLHKPYELQEHGISIMPDWGTTIDLVRDIGIDKFSDVLEQVGESRQRYSNFTRLINIAMSEGNSSDVSRSFLRQDIPQQLSLLLHSDDRDNVISKIVAHGDCSCLTCDASEGIKRAENVQDPVERRVMLSLLAMRLFNESKVNGSSESAVEFLNLFGIDPDQCESFPWTTEDVLHRADLYMRIKRERSRLMNLLIKAGTDPRDAQQLVSEVGKRVTAQDDADTRLPFTPHGWEHSLDVVEYQHQIFNSVPGLRDSLVAQFGSTDRARAVLDLVGLLHDIGYGRLKEGESKGIHAQRGGEMFLSELALLVKKTLGLDDMQIRAMHLAIERHGSDKPTEADYMTANARRNPLLFAIRLADNLDAAATRLRAVQRDRRFIRALQLMYAAGSLSEVEREARITEIKAAFAQKVRASMPAQDAAHLIALVKRMNHTSYPHFKGCEKITHINMADESGKLVVYVTIKGRANSGKIEEQTLRGVRKIDASLYQLWRLYQAAQSLTYRGRSLEFRYKQHIEWGGSDALQRTRQVAPTERFDADLSLSAVGEAD